MHWWVICYKLWNSFLNPKIITLFLPFFKVFTSEFLIQDPISQVIVNENRIFICQNLSLGVENWKKNKILKIEVFINV